MGKGGGNDGGIVSNARAFMVKTKEPERKTDTLEERNARWASCAMTGEPLTDPVVADELGHLMNREAVLTFLLEKRSVPAFAHIRRMRDVWALPSGEARDGARVFVCPVTQVEANAAHPFVSLRACGCVLADKALAEVKGEGCPACGKPWRREDAVRLVPTDEEAEAVRRRMDARREQAAAATDRPAAAGRGAGGAVAAAAAIAAPPSAVGGAAPAAGAAPPAPHGAVRQPAAGAKRAREADAQPAGQPPCSGAGGGGGAGAVPGGTRPAAHESVRAAAATNAAAAAAASVAAQKSSSAVYAKLFEKRPDAPRSGGGHGVTRW